MLSEIEMPNLMTVFQGFMIIPLVYQQQFMQYLEEQLVENTFQIINLWELKLKWHIFVV